MTFLLKYADTYGSVFPLLVLIYKRNLVPKENFILFWYFLLSIVIFSYSNYLADRVENNLYLYHIFSIIELTLLLQYFKKIIKSLLIKNLINWVTILFLIASALNILFLEKINSLNSNTQSIEFLLLIAFCFIYYMELASSDQIIYFFKHPVFWIVTGFFIYFSITIFIFSFYKYSERTYHTFTINFWTVQEVMYLLKNLIISYGILCFNKKK